ncbi:hypothetical protein JAAARDRAFT_625627 [Jaapia argillacea MUCL 33604]|uniref:C3H1-type domain-containing protein n=1 Tax=Jaapia argillacea MUCL 33604 TaxID=933084 RepID=A0A067PXZ9_9AGAM|nr:hypothetical protein JAAARDRAFT_625627 [Jaapia argillacea MUCL 33604]
MSVDQEWADRTACREYVSIYTSAGDERRRRLIDPRSRLKSGIHACGRRWCKYSHTLLDTSRLRLLVGDVSPISISTNEKLVTLEYVSMGGYGRPEVWNYGWKVTLYSREAQGTLERFTEPLVCEDQDVNLAISELADVLRSRGYPMPYIDGMNPTERRMTICNHYIEGNCRRGTRCPFNHDLFDVEQITWLVGHPDWCGGSAMPFFILRLDYLATRSSSWRMTLLARSMDQNLWLSGPPLSCENPNIHITMLSVESLAEIESEESDSSATSPPNKVASVLTDLAPPLPPATPQLQSRPSIQRQDFSPLFAPAAPLPIKTAATPLPNAIKLQSQSRQAIQIHDALRPSDPSHLPQAKAPSSLSPSLSSRPVPAPRTQLLQTRSPSGHPPFQHPTQAKAESALIADVSSQPITPPQALRLSNISAQNPPHSQPPQTQSRHSIRREDLTRPFQGALAAPQPIKATATPLPNPIKPQSQSRQALQTDDVPRPSDSTHLPQAKAPSVLSSSLSSPPVPAPQIRLLQTKSAHNHPPSQLPQAETANAFIPATSSQPSTAAQNPFKSFCLTTKARTAETASQQHRGDIPSIRATVTQHTRSAAASSANSYAATTSTHQQKLPESSWSPQSVAQQRHTQAREGGRVSPVTIHDPIPELFVPGWGNSDYWAVLSSRGRHPHYNRVWSILRERDRLRRNQPTSSVTHGFTLWESEYYQSVLSDWNHPEWDQVYNLLRVHRDSLPATIKLPLTPRPASPPSPPSDPSESGEWNLWSPATVVTIAALATNAVLLAVFSTKRH